MKSEETTAKPLVVSILSLSLLTVMAGAAVAPALGVIQEYFADSSPVLVQMIISIPAIFIVITNSIFPRLCKKFGAKALTMIGLLLYTVGGCIAGAFSQIVLVLIMRAFVGIGVGIIMPLSTGLLSFYFPPEKQAKLMGYSSAMNQMGGVVATLLSGVLATISWRLSFLVYLMGFFSIILCVIFVPNDRIHRSEESAVDRESDKSAVARAAEESASPNDKGVFRQNYVYIIAMFLLMTIFSISRQFCHGDGSGQRDPGQIHCIDHGRGGSHRLLRWSAVCCFEENLRQIRKISGSVFVSCRLPAADPCGRLVWRAGRIRLHWICQWRRGAVYHIRGFR